MEKAIYAKSVPDALSCRIQKVLLFIESFAEKLHCFHFICFYQSFLKGFSIVVVHYEKGNSFQFCEIKFSFCKTYQD